jgi:hypothetical protein
VNVYLSPEVPPLAAARLAGSFRQYRGLGRTHYASLLFRPAAVASVHELAQEAPLAAFTVEPVTHGESFVGYLFSPQDDLTRDRLQRYEIELRRQAQAKGRMPRVNNDHEDDSA